MKPTVAIIFLTLLYGSLAMALGHHAKGAASGGSKSYQKYAYLETFHLPLPGSRGRQNPSISSEYMVAEGL